MENFYKINISNGKAYVAKHLMGIGMSKAIAYRKISRKESGSSRRKVGCGPKAPIATKDNIEKLE